MGPVRDFLYIYIYIIFECERQSPRDRSTENALFLDESYLLKNTTWWQFVTGRPCRLSLVQLNNSISVSTFPHGFENLRNEGDLLQDLPSPKQSPVLFCTGLLSICTFHWHPDTNWYDFQCFGACLSSKNPSSIHVHYIRVCTPTEVNE